MLHRPLALALLAAGLAGSAGADIPPVPQPPLELPSAVAPDAIQALAGAYSLRDGTGQSACAVTLVAEHHDPFAGEADQFRAELDEEGQACFVRVFAAVGYKPAPLLWNVASGGGIALSFGARPQDLWLTFEPDRTVRGAYQVEANGQRLTLVVAPKQAADSAGVPGPD